MVLEGPEKDTKDSKLTFAIDELVITLSSVGVLVAKSAPLYVRVADGLFDNFDPRFIELGVNCFTVKAKNGTFVYELKEKRPEFRYSLYKRVVVTTGKVS